MRNSQRKYLEQALKEYAHLYENKDRLINKLTSLTPEQKEEVIAFFHKYPNYENKIDWNRKDLTFEDFESLLANAGRSKTQAKTKGLSGIREGKDYIVIEDKSPDFIAYQPLTYLGSKTIASNLVPPAKEAGAQWCTAYQKTTQYWDDYTGKGIKFIYVCDLTENTKYAIVLYPEDLYSEIECYSFGDEKIEVPRKYKHLCSKELNDYPPFDIQEDCIDTGFLVFNEKTHRYDCLDASKVIAKRLVEDGKFIVPLGDWNGDFYCRNTGLTSLEGAPQKVSGYFDCRYNQLTSLEGSPKYVGGLFVCADNRLTTLEGGPEEVKGSFSCSHNQLINLKGSPRYIDGYFDCIENRLISLEGSPKEIGGAFACSFNKLTTLEGAPEKVSGNFWCSNNNLTTLLGAPKEVGGHFDCSDNQLTSLKGCPKEITGNFTCHHNWLVNLKGGPEHVRYIYNCSFNELTSLEGAATEVGDDFKCNNNKLTTLEGGPEKVGGHFWCATNNLTNLNGAPELVMGYFWCDAPTKEEAKQLGFRIWQW